MTESTTTLISATLSEISEKLPTLKQSIILEENRIPRQSRFVIYGSAVLFCMALIGGSLIPYQQTVTAKGQISATNKIRTIRPILTGTIDKIAVKEGDYVKANQVILALDTHALQTELDALQITEKNLQVVADRMRAIGLNQDFDTEKYPNDLTKIVSDQKAIYEMQIKNKEDQKLALTTQLDQKRAQLALTLGQEHDLRQQMENAEQQRDVAKKLFEKKLGTGTDYRKAEENLAKIRRDLSNLINLSQEHRHQITDQESKVIELEAKLRTDALKEMTDISQQLTQIHEKRVRLQDQISSMEIKTPVSGIVQELTTKKLGDSLDIETPVAQIIPLEKMEIIVSIPLKESRNLKIGQEAKISLTHALDEPVIELTGQVVTIPERSKSLESGIPVTISLNRDQMTDLVKPRLITPGTEAKVTILTSKTSILENLLYPLR